MKNLKNQKGITLVALVITIIVLLILAGVSLSLVSGGDGILSKASNAVDQNEIASAKEQVELVVAEKQTDYYQAKYVDNDSNVTTMFAYVTDKLATGTTSDFNFTLTAVEGDESSKTVTVYRGSTQTTTLLTGKITKDSTNDSVKLTWDK
jgi:hypothetical protein